MGWIRQHSMEYWCLLCSTYEYEESYRVLHDHGKRRSCIRVDNTDHHHKKFNRSRVSGTWWWHWVHWMDQPILQGTDKGLSRKPPTEIARLQELGKAGQHQYNQNGKRRTTNMWKKNQEYWHSIFLYYRKNQWWSYRDVLLSYKGDG